MKVKGPGNRVGRWNAGEVGGDLGGRVKVLVARARDKWEGRSRAVDLGWGWQMGKEVES